MKDETSQPHASLTDFERALLDAARHDRVPSELKLHMAKALPDLGSSAAAHSGKLAEVGGAVGTKAWLWGTLFVFVCAGGYAALRPATGARSSQPAREPSAAFAAAAPVQGVQAPEPAGDRAAVADPATPSATPAAPPQAPSAGQIALPGETPAAPRALGSTARPNGARATAGSLASLQEELALLERARHALQSGAQHEAQLLLKQHSQRFARAALEPEAEALRIELSVLRGDPAQAKRAAERFLRRYSDHPLAVRVARLAAGL